MKRAKFGAFSLFALSACLSFVYAGQPAQRSAKEALQPLQDLIGSWRGTCTPQGTKEEQRTKFWVEVMSWEWKFKEKDAWLSVAFDKGKYFTTGELRFVAAKEEYELKVQTP